METSGVSVNRGSQTNSHGFNKDVSVKKLFNPDLIFKLQLTQTISQATAGRLLRSLSNRYVVFLLRHHLVKVKNDRLMKKC